MYTPEQNLRTQQEFNKQYNPHPLLKGKNFVHNETVVNLLLTIFTKEYGEYKHVKPPDIFQSYTMYTFHCENGTKESQKWNGVGTNINGGSLTGGRLLSWGVEQIAACWQTTKGEEGPPYPDRIWLCIRPDDLIINPFTYNGYRIVKSRDRHYMGDNAGWSTFNECKPVVKCLDGDSLFPINISYSHHCYQDFKKVKDAMNWIDNGFPLLSWQSMIIKAKSYEIAQKILEARKLAENYDLEDLLDGSHIFVKEGEKN